MKNRPFVLLLCLFLLGTGAFLLLFSLNLRLPILGRFHWARLSLFWPGFISIAGVACWGQFVLTGFQQRWLLVVGSLMLAASGLAFALTLDLLNPRMAQLLLKLWPLLLLLFGLSAIPLTRFRWRRYDHRD
jgi:drug/metabolite transporter (DMT)-like permease